MIADQGHLIGCHTWDHHKVAEYTARDWDVQLLKPTFLLSQITGKPVHYFSYPYGIWDKEAINQLLKHNYHAAFQLRGRSSQSDPEFTIPRILVDGNWDNAVFRSMITNHAD